MVAQERGVIIPKVVCANVFSIFRWDNIDLLEKHYVEEGQPTVPTTSWYKGKSQVALFHPQLNKKEPSEGGLFMQLQAR